MNYKFIQSANIQIELKQQGSYSLLFVLSEDSDVLGGTPNKGVCVHAFRMSMHGATCIFVQPDTYQCIHLW